MSNSQVLNAVSQDGLQNIYAGAIENAANNIKRYIDIGVIVDGKVTGHWPVCRRGKLENQKAMVRGEKPGASGAEQDLHFFRDGGECDMICESMGWNLTAAAIRDGLGI